MPVRGTPDMAAASLQAIRVTLPELNTSAEVLLLDDASEEGEVLEVLRAGARSMREAGYGARVWRAQERQHYLHGLSFGTQQACGSRVLWWQCDQIANPACWSEQLERIETPGVWGVRCCGSFVDGAQEGAQIAAPLGTTTYEQALRFAEYVASVRRGQLIDANPISTDGCLLRRETIDQLGVFDPRFYGYFGDWDYWVRCYRAGGRYALALGAWAHHEGAVHIKAEAMQAGGDEAAMQQAFGRRMALVQVAYEQFVAKWGITGWPERYVTDLPAELINRGLREAIANPGPAQHEWPELASKWERIL